MSGRQARQVRKEMNEIASNYAVSKKKVAKSSARELLNSPFKYRFLFAMKILFHRRKK